MKKKVLFIIVSIVLLIGFTSCDPIAKSIAEGVQAADPSTDPQAHEKYFEIDENGVASLKEGQTSLPTSLLIPQKVGSVAVKAIEDCFGTFESVRIPGHVKTISDFTFLNCPNLKFVIIDDGVESIGDGAFSGCSLTRVIINSSQTKVEIDPNAFPLSGTTEYWLGTHQCASLAELFELLEAI